jgi:hypothetical protein
MARHVLGCLPMTFYFSPHGDLELDLQLDEDGEWSHGDHPWLEVPADDEEDWEPVQPEDILSIEEMV